MTAPTEITAALSVPGRLEISPGGRVTGPARIQYNNPFPCRNGTPGGSAAVMMGVVQHTMVGNLPGTIAEFNNPAAQASADFGVDQTGLIHQFGPVGLDWEAWAQVYGNADWYDIEFADDGNPDNPMTDGQITAGAQLTELLSRFAGFPLQVTDSTSVKGLGVHYMGGVAWGGHSCPDLPPKHVRSSQRPAIIALAKQIRGGEWADYTTTGRESLIELAAEKGTAASTILRVTAIHDRRYSAGVAGYVNGGNLRAAMPAGLVLRVPA